MKETTLCYIEKDGAYLMMHRTKKTADVNGDKWIGIGGKIEKGEPPIECAVREIKEETGVAPLNLRYRGIVYFVSDIYPPEKMHLFTADDYVGNVDYDCNEGVLEWIKKESVLYLPIWEGDKIFLRLLDIENRFFHLTLNYKGDKLISHKLEY